MAIESTGTFSFSNLVSMSFSSVTKFVGLVKSENDGDLKNRVPLYGTAQMHDGLRSWFERHGVGNAEQFLAVEYGAAVGLDCPGSTQYFSLLPGTQIGFPTSLWCQEKVEVSSEQDQITHCKQ
jgi:hypothetical protein